MYRTFLKYVPKLAGLLFLFAGGSKLLHPGPVTLALVSLDIPFKLVNIIVPANIIIEIYLGVLLLARFDLRYAMKISMGLMFVFTLYMWYLSTMAHPPSCGCLGLTGVFNSKKAEAFFGLIRNGAILWALKLSYDFYFPRSVDLTATEIGTSPLINS